MQFRPVGIKKTEWNSTNSFMYRKERYRQAQKALRAYFQELLDILAFGAKNDPLKGFMKK